MSRSIWMASIPSHPRVMLPSVILNLSVRLSAIFTIWIIPESSLLYASWYLVKPVVVHETSILCLPWLFSSIIIAAVPHRSLKEPLLAFVTSPFLMASAMCLSVSSVGLYPVFRVLAWEVYFFSTFCPIPVHLMCPSLSVYTFVTLPCEEGSLVISPLILTYLLWLSLPCRLRTVL